MTGDPVLSTNSLLDLAYITNLIYSSFESSKTACLCQYGSGHEVERTFKSDFAKLSYSSFRRISQNVEKAFHTLFLLHQSRISG